MHMKRENGFFLTSRNEEDAKHKQQHKQLTEREQSESPKVPESESTLY